MWLYNLKSNKSNKNGKLKNLESINGKNVTRKSSKTSNDLKSKKLIATKNKQQRKRSKSD
jgi:hypothetical protein